MALMSHLLCMDSAKTHSTASLLYSSETQGQTIESTNVKRFSKSSITLFQAFLIALCVFVFNANA
jgi:hypothetical protein